MTMRCGRLNPALISFPGLVRLISLLISTRQHAEGIAFIIRNCEIALEGFDHLFGLPSLLILFCQAKQNGAVDGITHQHLLEDVDTRCGHNSVNSKQSTVNSMNSTRRLTSGCLLFTSQLAALQWSATACSTSPRILHRSSSRARIFPPGNL